MLIFLAPHPIQSEIKYMQVPGIPHVFFVGTMANLLYILCNVPCSEIPLIVFISHLPNELYFTCENKKLFK